MMTKDTGYGTYKNILICTDFSENADFAFRLAVGAAGRHDGSTLTLLHVLPEAEAQFWKNYIYDVEDVDAKAKADIDRKIDETYRPLLVPGVELKVVFKIGNPAQEIIKYANENKSDLVVLGRQGKGLVFYGNVAARVARHADCPVLVVPMAFASRSEFH